MSLTLFPSSLVGRNLSTHPLFSMQREMNKLFDDMVGENNTTKATQGIAPRIDVIENETNFHLAAELPGVEEKDIHLTVKDGYLKLSAEKKSFVEKSEKGSHYSERIYGKYERTLSLGEDIDDSAIEAVFKNGVLNVILPKKTPTQPVEKKIEIKTTN